MVTTIISVLLVICALIILIGIIALSFIWADRKKPIYKDSSLNGVAYDSFSFTPIIIDEGDTSSCDGCDSCNPDFD